MSKTKCPHCNSLNGFEVVAEDINLPDGKKNKMPLVRCIQCKSVITVFDRNTLVFCANQILKKLP